MLARGPIQCGPLPVHRRASSAEPVRARRRHARHSVAHAWPCRMHAHAAPPRSRRPPRRPSPPRTCAHPASAPWGVRQVRAAPPGCRWPGVRASSAGRPSSRRAPLPRPSSIQVRRPIAPASAPRASIAPRSAAIAVPPPPPPRARLRRGASPWCQACRRAYHGCGWRGRTCGRAAPRDEQGQVWTDHWRGTTASQKRCQRRCQKSFGAKV